MGTNLAEVLQRQGRRRDWLAAQLGVDKSTVTKWCKGERTPGPEHRSRVAQVLDVPEDEVFPAKVAA